MDKPIQPRSKAQRLLAALFVTSGLASAIAAVVLGVQFARVWL